jgi:hypothetical protein
MTITPFQKVTFTRKELSRYRVVISYAMRRGSSRNYCAGDIREPVVRLEIVTDAMVSTRSLGLQNSGLLTWAWYVCEMA